MRKLLASIAAGITLVMLGCGEAVSPTSNVELTSATTPKSVSAELLYQERELNATRYDLEYQDTWINITGIVGEIDGGEIRLVVDMRAYTSWDLFLEYVALHDLPIEVQANVNKNEKFTAVCKVGDYIFGIINLNNCKMPTVLEEVNTACEVLRKENWALEDIQRSNYSRFSLKIAEALAEVSPRSAAVDLCREDNLEGREEFIMRILSELAEG